MFVKHLEYEFLGQGTTWCSVIEFRQQLLDHLEPEVSCVISYNIISYLFMIVKLYNITFGIYYEMTTINNQMHTFPCHNDTFLCLCSDENIKGLVGCHYCYNLLLLSIVKYTLRKICQHYKIV